MTAPTRPPAPRLPEMQPSRVIIPPRPAPRLADAPVEHGGSGRGRRLLALLCLRPLGLCGRMLLFVTPLLLLAVGLLYLRIMFSPLAVDFLAAPLQRALNADLVEVSVGIDGAVLHRTERGGVELRLRNLVLHDRHGQRIADATWAEVEISMRALMSARLAPVRVELIEPRILLAVDAGGHLSVSLGDRGKADGRGTDERRAPSPQAQPSGTPGTGDSTTAHGSAAPPTAASSVPVEPGRLLVDVMARLRQTGDGSDHLRSIGARNAIVIVDDGRHRASVRLLTFRADLRQKLPHQFIATTARIAGPDGPWAVAARIEPTEGGGGAGPPLKVSGEIAGLVPTTLAELPWLGALAPIDAPLTATGTLDIAADGALTGWRLAADLGRGHLGPPAASPRMPLVSARLEARYSAATRRIDVQSLPLDLDAVRVTLAGSARLDDGGVWRFDLASRDGTIGGATRTAPDVAIERLTARGHLGPTGDGVVLDEVAARVAGADLRITGRIGGEQGTDLSASAAPLSVDRLRALLPRGTLPACDSALDRLSKGTVTARAIRLQQPSRPDRGGVFDLSLTVEGQDLEIETARGLPPLEAPRALLRLDAGVLEVSIPEAHITAAGGRRVLVRGGRAVVSAIGAEQQTAEMVFRVQGPLPAFLDLLDREPVRLFNGAGPPAQGIDGKVDGQLKVTLPIGREAKPGDTRIEGRGRITDGRVKDLVGPHDISGATVTIEGSEQNVDLKGELLLAGVVVKATGNWQPLAPDRKPPLVEFTTTLDRAYRVQLGLDLEHMISGSVPVRVQIRDLGTDNTRVNFSADLTPAEVSIADIYWSKPAKASARLEFDVVKGQAAKSLELQNFKLVGEKVAIDGWVGIGPDSKAREYYFPEFSINVVTNLSVRGKLRPDRVWEVSARGKTYDARDLFRSFYQFGLEHPPGVKNRPGVDLEAEIETVIGLNDSTLRRLRLSMQERSERLTALDLTGVLASGQTLTAQLRPQPGRPRLLTASTNDAGEAMKLIGFYSSLVGGMGEMTVNLDGSGAVEKSGEVRIRRFQLLGDPIVSQVLESADGTRPAIEQGVTTRRRIVREQFDFDRLTASVAVGNGQLALDHVVAEGPLIGASMRGKVDFRSRRMQLGGTYVPLSGLNRALSGVPLLNFLLTGPRGEGIFGITFAVEGPMSDPNVLVNPLSLMTPGVLRELFQMAPENPRITPKAEPRPVQGPAPQLRSSPPSTGSAPRREGQPQAGGKQSPRGDGEVLDGWSATARPR